MNTILVGPVESHGDMVALCIPLVSGGDQFIELLRDVARVEADDLVVTLPRSLGFAVGSIVELRRTAAAFEIRPASSTPKASARMNENEAAIPAPAWRRVGRVNSHHTTPFGFLFTPNP